MKADVRVGEAGGHLTRGTISMCGAVFKRGDMVTLRIIKKPLPYMANTPLSVRSR